MTLRIALKARRYISWISQRRDVSKPSLLVRCLGALLDSTTHALRFYTADERPRSEVKFCGGLRVVTYHLEQSLACL